MKLKQDSGKYILESELRTWSDYKRLRKEEEARRNPLRRNTLSAFLHHPQPEKSPSITGRKWGGCPEGCDHKDHDHGKQNDNETKLPPSAADAKQPAKNEKDDHPLSPHEPVANEAMDGTADSNSSTPARSVPNHLLASRNQFSGADTPHEMPSDDEREAYPFPETQESSSLRPSASIAQAMRAPQRQPTPEDIQRWANESGMGSGRQADPLGDDRELGQSEENERKIAEGEEDLEAAEKQDKSLRGSVY